jgi:hypothetical protein
MKTVHSNASVKVKQERHACASSVAIAFDLSDLT